MKRLLNKYMGGLFGYLIVGGLATIVEWVGFWLFGRLLVFRGKQNRSLLGEILSVYLASVVGLLLNLLIMFVLVQLLTVGRMPAKIIATILVFAYNYLIRKLVIYKK